MCYNQLNKNKDIAYKYKETGPIDLYVTLGKYAIQVNNQRKADIPGMYINICICALNLQ